MIVDINKLNKHNPSSLEVCNLFYFLNVKTYKFKNSEVYLKHVSIYVNEH